MSIVGMRPLECDPRAGDGTGEIDERPGPTAAIRIPLLLVDPDCRASTGVGLDASPWLAWRDGATDHNEPVTATQRIAWRRSGAWCVVSVDVRLAGGPVGQRGSIRPCQTALLADDWATFAAFPVTLASLMIDAERVALDIAWRPEPVIGPCEHPVIERDTLTLAISAELSIPLDAWQRLHPNLLTLAISAAIEVR